MFDTEFERIGQRLACEGLVSASAGNLSVRSGDGLAISRAGCYLEEPGAPVQVPMTGAVPPGTSSEYRVHRAVYRATPYRAIVHAHPVHAVAASFLFDEIVPLDSEGELRCPRIPVVSGPPGSDDLAEAVAGGLEKATVVISRGHGTFAGGATLHEAYHYTALAEHACRILLILGAQGR